MVLVLMCLVFVLVRISNCCCEWEQIMRSIRIYLRSDAWLMVDLMLSHIDESKAKIFNIAYTEKPECKTEEGCSYRVVPVTVKCSPSFRSKVRTRIVSNLFQSRMLVTEERTKTSHEATDFESESSPIASDWSLLNTTSKKHVLNRSCNGRNNTFYLSTKRTQH